MHGGAIPFEALDIPGGVWVAPVVGVSGVATTSRMWAEPQKLPVLLGGFKPAAWQLAMTTLIAQAGADAIQQRGVLTRKGQSPAQGLLSGTPGWCHPARPSAVRQFR